MKKIITLLTLFTLILFAFAGGESKKVAVIKMKRGKAIILKPDGSKVPAVKGEWVTQGSVIKTQAKSFVRLSFIDKSTVNVGPSSEMKIEKFSKQEAGVLNVISGKIRSKVSKDYLQMNKKKSKLFVKSKSAVMGVRGTDFVYSYNPRTDSATTVLFEGSIVFNKINRKNMKMQLEDIVNKGHKIAPGQFSVSKRGGKKPTIPAKMSTRQIKALEKNANFINRETSHKVAIKKSIVPPGLTGEVVMATATALENGIKKVVKADVHSTHKKLNKEDVQKSKGYIQGDLIKPVDGSIVHIDSGTIIPLGTDSVFDSSQGEWVSNSVGGVDPAGNYVPPEGYKITNEGNLLKLVDGGQTQEVILNIAPLGDNPPLFDMPTQDYQQPINGPAPAGTSVPPPPPEDGLAPPPNNCFNCMGQLPPSFNVHAPGAGGTGTVPRTPVRIKVIKGN